MSTALGGYFMDRFTHAERATDWRGNNNIAESIYEQLALEPHPEPAWVVVGAGTGGTSADHRPVPQVPTPARPAGRGRPGAFVVFDAWHDSDPELRSTRGSRIEGIGRPIGAGARAREARVCARLRQFEAPIRSGA